MYRLSSRFIVLQVRLLLLFCLPLITENLHLETKIRHLQNPWIGADVQNQDPSLLCLQGYYQTPIHIENRQVESIFMPTLNFINYENFIAPPIVLKNNGYTVKLFPGEYSRTGDRPLLTGGFLGNREYQMENLHFHWGAGNDEGSEHVINNVRYPMEMHVVHRNRNYTDWNEAAKHKDGFAVLAFFFQLRTQDNHRFKILVDKLEGLRHEGSLVRLDRSFPLSLLLPRNKDSFFTYRGSLSTPPCSEAVIWFVFPETIPISFRQMQHFRSLLVGGKNYRSVQPSGRRRIFYRHHQRFLRNTDMFNYYNSNVSLESLFLD